MIYDANQLSLPKALTAEQYSQYEHILVSFSGTRKGMVDKALEELGLQRRIAVAVPSVAAVPALLKSQPIITTLPAYTAAYLAKQHGFELVKVPVTTPQVDISLVWHRKHEHDSQHQWSRELVQELFSILLKRVVN